jgi:polysaccharide biosynthesis/export protein
MENLPGRPPKTPYMKLQRIAIPLLALPILFFSCKPMEKTGNYLEDVSSDTSGTMVTVPDLRIQKGDMLTIQIFSHSTRPEIDELYNPPIGAGASTGTTGGAGTATGGGYLVDNNGMIEHPRLGIFHAEGLTKHELAAEVKKRLLEPVELLRNPTVIVRFSNLKVTVVGEVTSPGTISVASERLTILEALGLSGDFTKFGKKHTVRVVREMDGKREIGTIDLTSVKLFESPYYNLKQNDIVFVEATKQKQKQDEQSIVAQRVTFALSLITAAAFIYNIFQ